jgi:putative PIN family toxin of toxin-antitoxin system
MPWPGLVRIVLDTNVLVSNLLSAGGPPGQLFDAWLDHRFELVTSRVQLVELTRVLRYERIASRLPPERVSEPIRNMQIATVVEPAEGIELSADPDDNMILATAIAGEADLIVSGDKTHPLALGSAEGIAIVTSRDALMQIEKQTNHKGE